LDSDHPVNVFLTVDTEHSIGGAFLSEDAHPVGNDAMVWGRIGSTQYGIPRIMDIADTYGLPLTFFLEVLNKHYFGERESREVCEYILKRNHDVQLHLHPNYLNFALDDPRSKPYTDLIGRYNLQEQVHMLEEGRELLRAYGAPGVCAFRAGCFGANETTLEAVGRAGLLVDSSYNAAYSPYPCLIPDRGINDFAYIKGVGELPITNFRENLPFRKRLKPLDINGASGKEIAFVLGSAARTGQRNAVVILHSFSFIKPMDFQYRVIKPRNHVVRRFERICRFLAENKASFRVRTFASLRMDELPSMNSAARHSLLTMPAALSAARYCEQMKDELL